LHWIREVAYELEIPSGRIIHNVFHVSFLNKDIRKHVIYSPNLPPLDDECKLFLEPKSIIKIRIKRLIKRSIIDHLVKWKELPLEYVTW